MGRRKDVLVNLRVPRELRERFAQVVMRRGQTLSQAIRAHMEAEVALAQKDVRDVGSTAGDTIDAH